MPLPVPENRLDLLRIGYCSNAVRVQLSGRARAFQARDGGSIPAHPLQCRSAEPADLLDAPRSASAATHRGDRVPYTGVLPVPSNEGRDRDVARMSAPARDPERAAAQTAKPPPFEAQLQALPVGVPDLAGA